jgi:hypothetical protein
MIALALALGGPTRAEEGEWLLQLEPIFVDAYGHDQHVLTVHEIDFDSTPTTNVGTPVTLDTDSGFGYRAKVQFTKGKWGVGLDIFSLMTSQNAPPRGAAADDPSGTLDEVVFEIADRGYTSSGAGEVLFYEVLEDTDLAMWTADLYGSRTLAENPKGGVHLLFGLRLGDFDNDYRAVVGLQDVAGTRMDGSSNYDRMMGPYVGLAGAARHGRNRVECVLGQSVLIGNAELGIMYRDFTGPFGETPAFVSEESYRTVQDVAIPVTEFRLQWTYRVSKTVALGAGTRTSAWWDVPVPPGAVPGDGGGALQENTIVLFGLQGIVELTF